MCVLTDLLIKYIMSLGNQDSIIKVYIHEDTDYLISSGYLRETKVHTLPG